MTRNESLDQFDTTSAALAVQGEFNVAQGASECDRNVVFGSLVVGDDDIVGLIAYSIYKQNKHDWLVAFNKAKGHEPGESEVSAYIIGESTPRRLATYRHLAEATLAGQSPTSGTTGTESFKQRNFAIAARYMQPKRGASASAIWGAISLIGLAVIALAGFMIALRFNVLGPLQF